MNKYQLYTLGGALLAATALTGAARAEVPGQFVNAQTGTTYTVVQTDCSKLVTFSNTSAVAVTLPAAGTAGAFFGGCFIDFENKGAGVVTITPTTSTINGGSTYVLNKNQGVHAVSDGTNYQTQVGTGLGAGVAPCTSTSGGECDGLRGVVTTSSLSTGVHTGGTVAFTNNLVGTASVILCTAGAYSGTLNTNGYPVISECTPTAGVITVTILNTSLSASLSGTLDVQFAVLK